MSRKRGRKKGIIRKGKWRHHRRKRRKALLLKIRVAGMRVYTEWIDRSQRNRRKYSKS